MHNLNGRVLMLMNEKGFALISSIIIMVLLAALGAFSVSILSADIGIAVDSESSAKAFFIAEAGVQHLIYKIVNDSVYRESPVLITADFADGSFEANAVTEDNIEYTITSTGRVGEVARRTEQVIEISGVDGVGSYTEGVPQSFSYAMHSFGSHTKFKNSQITVNGNIGASNQIQQSSGITVNGDKISNSSVSSPFTINMAGYLSVADSIEDNGFVFSQGTTYGSSGNEEIWYITGNVIIEDNVVIYGSVIADNNIDIQASGIFIDSASGFPCLIAGNNIQGDGLENATLNGLIAADNNVDFDSLTNVVINGVILADNNIQLRYGDADTVINYDSEIWSNPPPYFQGYSENKAVTLKEWDEIY
ncbi:MAG: pilus assembly PilX N-terminal domain-containing protein [Candidatus Omnitrophota bacterium]